MGKYPSMSSCQQLAISYLDAEYSRPFEEGPLPPTNRMDL